MYSGSFTNRVLVLLLCTAALLLCTAALPAIPLSRSGAQSGRSQSNLTAVAAKDYALADAELNRAYMQLMKALEPEPRAKLKLAELAWLKFRDAEGTFRASEFKGAKLQPVARLGYLEGLTRRRTQELRDAFKQFAGD